MAKKKAAKNPVTKKGATAKATAKRSPLKRKAAKKAKPKRDDCDVGCPKGAIRPKFLNPVPQESKSIEEERQQRWPELMQQYQKGTELIRKYGDRLLKNAEVTGVHVGFKRIGDQIVRPLRYCIRISVRRKRKPEDQRIVKPLPKTLQGFPVDVFERTYETIADTMTQPTRGASKNTKSLKSKSNQPYHNAIIDPLRGGIVIADKDTPENWGTLGLIGKDRNGKRYGLTCAHVAGSSQSRSSVVTQPAKLTAKTVIREIGKVVYSARNNSVDASVIEIDGQWKSRRQAILSGKENYLAGSIGFGSAIPEARAFKIGAATNPEALVHGRIQITTGVVEIKGFGTMTDQIVVVNDSGKGYELIKPGDSGAVLLMMTDHEDVFVVVGLVHAKTSDGAIVACPWNKVLEHFPHIQF